MIPYTVTPIPVKRRVRFTRQGHSFTDDKTREDLKRVRESYKGPLFEGAVGIIATIYKPLPKSERWPKQYTQKPDIDNVAKALMDGLNGVAFLDDAQVTSLNISKFPRIDHDGVERVEYQVYSLEPKHEL